MTIIRLRYENGQLIPLDPLPDLHDGDEIEVELRHPDESGDLKAMLDRTRGLWADWEDVEAGLDDARSKWDQAWQERLSSS